MSAYFTDVVEKIDDSRIYPLSKIDSSEYFLFIPETRICDDEFFLRLSSYGVRFEKDFFALRHIPFAAKDRRNVFCDNCTNLMSPLSVFFTGYNNKVVVEDGVRFPKNFSITLGSNSNIYIGKNSIFKPRSLMLLDGVDLVIKESTIIEGMDIYINVLSSVFIGSRCTFQTGKLRTGRNQKIEIGNDVMASWDIVFLPHDGHLIWNVENGKCINNTTGEQRKSIVIDDHVWLGGECVLAENTRVGCGSIVAYRSFVKGIYPNNCVIAGIPGKIIKENIAWSRQNATQNEANDYNAIPEIYRQVTKDK